MATGLVAGDMLVQMPKSTRFSHPRRYIGSMSRGSRKVAKAAWLRTTSATFRRSSSCLLQSVSLFVYCIFRIRGCDQRLHVEADSNFDFLFGIGV